MTFGIPRQCLAIYGGVIEYPLWAFRRLLRCGIECRLSLSITDLGLRNDYRRDRLQAVIHATNILVYPARWIR